MAPLGAVIRLLTHFHLVWPLYASLEFPPQQYISLCGQFPYGLQEVIRNLVMILTKKDPWTRTFFLHSFSRLSSKIWIILCKRNDKSWTKLKKVEYVKKFKSKNLWKRSMKVKVYSCHCHDVPCVMMCQRVPSRKSGPRRSPDFYS